MKFKWLRDHSVKITKTPFSNVKDFFSIAQSGTMADGFDYELPHTLRELMGLRMDNLHCQTNGSCLKPYKND